MFVAPGVNRACPDSLSGGLNELPSPFPLSLKERGRGEFFRANPEQIRVEFFCNYFKQIIA
jgi:hypothetical protein